MKELKYLDEGVKITLYRYSQKNLEEFFTMEGTLVACKDVVGLFKASKMRYCSDELWLFIDSCKVSLSCSSAQWECVIFHSCGTCSWNKRK
jgi:hypothetical protein